jgi:hypothetical protein
LVVFIEIESSQGMCREFVPIVATKWIRFRDHFWLRRDPLIHKGRRGGTGGRKNFFDVQSVFASPII